MSEPNEREREIALSTSIELEHDDPCRAFGENLAAYREELLSDPKMVLPAFQAIAKDAGALSIEIGCQKGRVKVYLNCDAWTLLAAYEKHVLERSG